MGRQRRQEEEEEEGRHWIERGVSLPCEGLEIDSVLAQDSFKIGQLGVALSRQDSRC